MKKSRKILVLTSALFKYDIKFARVSKCFFLILKIFSCDIFQVWFQNKRSKERKGKISKEKENAADDDEAADDSQPSSPVTTTVSSELIAAPEETSVETTSKTAEEIMTSQ